MQIPQFESNPLVKQEVESPKPVSWVPVLIALVGLPLAAAAILAFGMGNPQKTSRSETVWAALQIPAVTTSEFEALEYKELLFSRLVLGDPEARKQFLLSIKDYEVGRGRAVKPISFDLKRDWWDPPDKESGTFWKRGKNMIWNPDSRSECFFVVAEKSLAAGE